MQVLPAKVKDKKKNCTGRYSRGLRNQNGEHVVSVFESNVLEIQVIFPAVNQPEIYFPLKVQIT